MRAPFLLLAASLYAQVDTASLRVLVTDPTGAAVAGAQVELTNTETNTNARLASNGEGYAVFTPVARGTYRLDVAHQGFRAVQVTGVVINVSDRRLVRVPLTLASTTIGMTIFFTFMFSTVIYVALPLGQGVFQRISIAVLKLLWAQ